MEFLITLYLALPAFAANMAPVIAVRLGWGKRWMLPVDGGRTWRGKRLLGENKTRLGFAAGALAGSVVALAQYAAGLAGWLPWPVPYGYLGAFAYGALGGFGALLGDAAESFVKRQLGIASGRPFIPFDQTDYIFGFLVLTYPLYAWNAKDAVFLLVFAAVANPLANLAGYLLKIKNTYW